MSEWNDAIEAAAQIVDLCNHADPYNAIGAASLIRDLKRPEANCPVCSGVILVTVAKKVQEPGASVRPVTVPE